MLCIKSENIYPIEHLADLSRTCKDAVIDYYDAKNVEARRISPQENG